MPALPKAHPTAKIERDLTMATVEAIGAPVAKRKEPKIPLTRVLGRWAFMWPMLALNLIVIVIPSLAGLGIAFTEWSGYGQPVFIGLENFETLLDDPVFFKALGNNIVWTAVFLTIPIFMGLLGAYLLAGIKRGQMILRVLYFIPFVLASVVNAQVWRFLLHHRVGIGPWLADHGITDILDVALFGKPETALFTVAFVDMWHFWGFPRCPLSGGDVGSRYRIVRGGAAGWCHTFSAISLRYLAQHPPNHRFYPPHDSDLVGDRI